METGYFYGKFCHPLGILFNRRNINIRKKTLKKLPFYKLISPKSKVLEVGGTGQDAVAFAELGFDTTFIDLSLQNITKTKKFIKQSKKKISLRCINSDFLKFDFKQKFDVVRSRGVIHHMEKPEKALRKINNLLNNGGYFHFNLYRSGVFYYWFIEHLRKFTKRINFENFINILRKYRLKKAEKKKFGNPTIFSKNEFQSIITDDLYVSVLNTANYFDILKDLNNLNFKIIKQNKIRHRLNHNLIYPDFPIKKNHIVFDCKKKGSIKVKKSYYTNLIGKEIKISLKDKIINENNILFEKIYKKFKKQKLNNNKEFIKKIIDLYKFCYLVSLKKINKKKRHSKIKKKLIDLLENVGS